MTVKIHNANGDLVGCVVHRRSVPVSRSEVVDTFACFDANGEYICDGEPGKIISDQSMREETCREFFARTTGIETGGAGWASTMRSATH